MIQKKWRRASARAQQHNSDDSCNEACGWIRHVAPNGNPWHGKVIPHNGNNTKLCTGQFFAALFQLQEHIICRYIESGIYNGMAEGLLSRHLASSAKTDGDKILMLQVFNAADIAERLKLNYTKNKSRQDKTKNNCLSVHKKNVNKSAAKYMKTKQSSFNSLRHIWLKTIAVLKP